MKIVTDRLIIRPFKMSDDDDLYDMCSDPKTASDAGWTPHSNKDVSRSIILGYMYSKETLAIVHKEDRRVIGTISLYENTIRKKVNCREMGFCLNRFYRNRGYMTEAVEAMLEYGFYSVKADIIMICHHSENYASEALIKKFPFVYEGLLRSYRTIYPNHVVDAKMYSMKKCEYDKYLEEKNI